MFNKILAQIAIGLVDALLKRIETGKIAVDADVDRDRLRRAGSRIDEWLREQDRIHSRGQSDTSGTESKDASLHAPKGGVDSKQQ